jgi:hypothetical protein
VATQTIPAQEKARADIAKAIDAGKFPMALQELYRARLRPTGSALAKMVAQRNSQRLDELAAKIDDAGVGKVNDIVAQDGAAPKRIAALREIMNQFHGAPKTIAAAHAAIGKLSKPAGA